MGNTTWRFGYAQGIFDKEAELKALKADNLSLVNALEKQNILYQQIRAELKAHELNSSRAFSELALAKVKVEAELATWQKKAIAAEYEAVRSRHERD